MTNQSSATIIITDELPDPSRSQAIQLFQQAQALVAETERVSEPDVVIKFRQQANCLYLKAAKLQPDLAGPHRCGAINLLDLAFRSQDATQRRAYVLEALERGDAANRCVSAEWDEIRKWASVLVAQVDKLAPDTADRSVILEAARKSYERSLEKVSFASQRPPVELELADCLMRLASLTTDLPARRAHYEQAVARFNSAGTAKPELVTGRVENLWGSACLELGKLSKEAAILSQSVEHLERGVEQTRDVTDARYNLACTHALLGEREAALKHLRLCLESDQGRFREMAAADPDLASLRETAEFTELLKPKSPGMDTAGVFSKGKTSQRLAEDAKEGSDALKHYGEAIQYYTRVVENRTDFADAHGRWARCLFGMARHTTNLQKRNQLIATALARYDVAAKCADVTFYYYRFASNEILGAAFQPGIDFAQKHACLQAARENFEAGCKLAESDSDRRALEQPLAKCLTYLGTMTTDTKERRALFTRATALFESAAPVVGKHTDANTLAVWGLALLQLGQIDRDPSTLRLSIIRLLAAAEREFNSANERYNLACAYAALNQPEQAVRHLRLCWENDPDEVFRKMAEKDRDLQSIRSSTAYKQLLDDYPPAPPP